MTAYPKSRPVRDKSYLRWVASLPCAHCGIEGYTQAAHADQGKGIGFKASDDTCYPACGPRLSVPGCHWLLGTSGAMGRDRRRELEAKYAEQTQALYKGKNRA